MAKRFTDTEKWKKQWIRALPTELKLFWVYILDDCDHAGIWEVDLEIANLKLRLNLTEEQILTAFGKRIIPLKNGRKWFVPKFVHFQYGELNPSNRVHASVISHLQKQGAIKLLTSPLQGAKEKDKDKEKDKEKESFTPVFDELWEKYPNKSGKAAAQSHFKSTVKTQIDLDNIRLALEHYLNSKRVHNNYIQNGSTWFNQWRDWVTYSEDVCKKCNGTGRFISTTGYDTVCSCPDGKKNKIGRQT